MTMPPLVIIGGHSPVGSYLMQRLKMIGLTAQVISRRPLIVPDGFTHISVDLNISKQWSVEQGSIVISLLPLWILADFLPSFHTAQSIIATGSTSRYSKAMSADALERSTAEKLEHAEDILIKWAEDRHIHWTLLRPTMIYDGRHDQNITRMARFIKRWHFLPVGSPAMGLRQPIHGDDVAQAIIQSIDNPQAFNRAFNIAGGEILSYRAMAERVFNVLGLKVHFIMLPVRLLRYLFRFLVQLGLVKEASFGASIFQRMNENLVFDVEDGLKALDYQPRRFMPEFPDM